MRDHRSIASDAVKLVRPSIDQLFTITNRQQLHIVIMNPCLKPWEASFEQAVLYQTSIGNPSEWTIPFDEYALEKAKQAWRDNKPNIVKQVIHPSSLCQSDLLFYGSFVYGDIVVACSGVEQWFDMLISGWIAVAFEQLSIHEYQHQKKQSPTLTHR
ncbi:hypothetical protein [Vibrio sonorensis]|uniref:hypothetical protein n=1 Tax=Vibrio sonorensis TaxID=1004316 RepID=UPI0008D9C340|nr:hypothetical protein [Vibrio sonorensis]